MMIEALESAAIHTNDGEPAAPVPRAGAALAENQRF